MASSYFEPAASSSAMAIEHAPENSAHGAPEQLDPAAKADDAQITEREIRETGSSSEQSNIINVHGEETLDEVRNKDKSWFAYMKTRDFYVLLVLGQVLALCLTTTSTMTTFLQLENTIIPAFQSLFNYILLFLTYHTYTVYRYGWAGYWKFLKAWWWKYLIFSFCDVEGNYFTVLAYNYTNLLSAQLINFWAIVVVIVMSFLFLKVRYHFMQIIGVLVCIGGLGILLASDHITNTNQYDGSNALKGDLFALLGATFYGFSNITEEFFVSKRPLYEVVGMMGLFGMIINGVQAGIFDRASFQSATWNSLVGGYLTGYTLALSLFYSLGPLIFRMGSAVFLNISLLTTNFWGVCIGTQVFGYTIHYLYPIAFVCIILGQVVYFLGKKTWGDAFKPWLGKSQEKGISGVGTAKRRAENPDVIV